MEYNYGGRTIPHMPVGLDFKEGKLYASERPGLGVELDMKQLKQIAEITQPTTARAQTYLRPDGGIASRFEFHGTVERVGEGVVEVRRADNGDIFTLPAGSEAYEPAPPGEYRLKTTGEVVVDPDFTCVMTVHPAQKPVED